MAKERKVRVQRRRFWAQVSEAARAHPGRWLWVGRFCSSRSGRTHPCEVARSPAEIFPKKMVPLLDMFQHCCYGGITRQERPHREAPR